MEKVKMGKFYEADLKAKHFSFGVTFSFSKEGEAAEQAEKLFFYGADVRAKHFSFGVTFSFSKEGEAAEQAEKLYFLWSRRKSETLFFWCHLFF